MEERRNEIEKYINMLRPKENKEEIIKYQINQIRNKFVTLDRYEYVTPEELSRGMVIRYVDLCLNKVSIYGIVCRMQYYPQTGDEKKIRSVLLFNPSLRFCWRITPKRYYIFHIDRSRFRRNKVKKFLGQLGILNETDRRQDI